MFKYKGNVHTGGLMLLWMATAIVSMILSMTCKISVF